MEFLKKNLFMVICGAVALLALASLYWPLSGKASDLKDAMDKRLQQAKVAENLSRAQIHIADKNITGFPVIQAVIDTKARISKTMKDQTAQIADFASNANQKGRVISQNGALVALLGNQPASSDNYTFKAQYKEVFNKWLIALVDPHRPDVSAALPTMDPASATAISMVEVNREWNDRVNAIKVKQNNLIGTAPTGAPVADPGIDQDWVRSVVKARANSLRMYVLPGAFQRLPFADGDNAPDETQMAEALLDCWIQQDVVDAIDAVNLQSTVAENPIKRLDQISIGEVNTIFVSGAPNSINPTTGLDYTKSMTGRVSNDQRDVTALTVTLVATPSAINQFIQKLYLQSNAYTVLNIKITTVDPFEAAGNGFIYGDSDAVSATISIEALLFKAWTGQIFPKDFAAQHGGAASAPPVTPP